MNSICIDVRENGLYGNKYQIQICFVKQYTI